MSCFYRILLVTTTVDNNIMIKEIFIYYIVNHAYKKILDAVSWRTMKKKNNVSNRNV